MAPRCIENAVVLTYFWARITEFAATDNSEEPRIGLCKW